jgi:uncharacterized Fe-S cluster protein YjdI
MRVIFGLRILISTLQTLIIIVILTAAQNTAAQKVQSQPANPETTKTPDPKGTPPGNQPSGQTGTGQPPPGQTQTGQAPKGQTPKAETPKVTKPAAALCRSPDQQIEYLLTQGDLGKVESEIAAIKTKLRGFEVEVADRTVKIAHYDKVINGKEELFDEEKAASIMPAAAGKVGTGFPKRSCSNKRMTLESDSTPLNQTLAAIMFARILRVTSRSVAIAKRTRDPYAVSHERGTGADSFT